MGRVPEGRALFSRRYYIQRMYQSKIILKFCLLTILGAAVFCISFYFAVDRDMGGGYAQALDGLRAVRGGMARTLMLTGGGALLVLGAAVVVMTLLMSHRIAGPLWRIERCARAIGAGDLSFLIRLRKNDEMRRLADRMNDMIAELRGFVEELGRQHELLERDIRHMKELGTRADVPAEELSAVTMAALERSTAIAGELTRDLNQVNT